MGDNMVECVKCGRSENKLMLDRCGYRHYECPPPTNPKELAMQIVRLPKGPATAKIPHTEHIAYQFAHNIEHFGPSASVNFVRLWDFDIEMLQEIARRYLDEIVETEGVR